MGMDRPETRRARILSRDRNTCAYCGLTFDPRELTLDHVEPRVKGGDHSEGNLVTACVPCNTAKAGEAAWSYLARNPDVRAVFLRNAKHIWPRLIRAIEEAARRRP